MFEVEKDSLVSVKIGEKTYYDESNGIMNSLSSLHRITVPMDALDSAKKYTVCVRPLIERKPYFTETEEPLQITYGFTPVPQNNIRAYHIADAHNRIDEPVAAAKTFGKMDFLILNGDILNHSGDPSKFENIYIICAKLTNGNIPVVFSRGNHDLRGNFAERFADYTPSQNRNTYYSFRLGSVWGVLLDCAEDKDDTHPEYGHTVACHCFRERQTEYLKQIIENKENEYAAKGIKTRLVIAHNPFTEKLPSPFDIEKDIYTEWAKLLAENVKPDVMICGHIHQKAIHYPNTDDSYIARPCPVVVGSEPSDEKFIGCGYIFGEKNIEAVFTDSDGNTVASEILNK